MLMGVDTGKEAARLGEVGKEGISDVAGMGEERAFDVGIWVEWLVRGGLGG